MKDGESPARRLVDSLVSRALRYDASRQDVVKWTGFARNLLGVLVLSVAALAGVLAAVSTWQARELLERALLREGEAVAASAARAAFVPLTLEDDAALSDLADSYAAVEDLAYLRVIDAGGRVRAERVRPGHPPAVEVRTPVLPRVQVMGPAPARPLGEVAAGMSTRPVRQRALRIALANAAASAALAGLVCAAGFLVIARLTERMRDLVGEARLAEELKAANAELEAFSYSVSHDLRAPLRHISGYIELLRGQVSPLLDAEGLRRLDVISGAARRMGRLIDDLLAFSRVGRAPLHRRPSALGPVVSGVLEELKSDAAGRNVVWKVGELPTVPCDPDLMRLVFANLLGNALKFTRPRDPAVIEIGWRPEAGEAVVYVRDNGVGFNMEYAPKLFRVFERLHRQDEFEGTGIGLANARRIVERHGGRTWAESAPDAGATFFVAMPRGNGAGTRGRR